MSLIDTLLMKQVMDQYFLSLKGKRPMTGILEIVNDDARFKFYNSAEQIKGWVGYDFASNLFYIYSYADMFFGASGDFTIQFDKTIEPYSHDSHDFGSASLKWKDGYFARTVYLADLNISDEITGDLIPSASNTYDIGSTHVVPPLRRYWKNAYFDGIIYTDAINELTSGVGIAIPQAGNITLLSNKILNAINSILRLPNSRPASPQAGDCRYNPATDTFEIYDGVSWNPH